MVSTAMENDRPSASAVYWIKVHVSRGITIDTVVSRGTEAV